MWLRVLPTSASDMLKLNRCHNAWPDFFFFYLTNFCSSFSSSWKHGCLRKSFMLPGLSWATHTGLGMIWILRVVLSRPHHSSSGLLMSIFLQWTLTFMGTVITTIFYLLPNPLYLGSLHTRTSTNVSWKHEISHATASFRFSNWVSYI